MEDLNNVVDSLEKKIHILLQKLDGISEQNEALSKELTMAQQEHQRLQQETANWQEKYNSLKLANSMLGSTQDKTEAKLKINTLIRELDHCIMQLSE
ncbi:hypothetical protein SAMN05216480_12225 [Pustulibacterium marinum]|uniref:Cell division protein ZapB n=1 Tax=Pustulibacterium marinum TaxID=1224947 RepID=A0A1I7IUR1_9FLAO|nr:hypothetical protein [Pustulibacterium marinum]SFU76660.1 hypothetical protein SAMN05216480_12225 [Pustulibacterium marinum]